MIVRSEVAMHGRIPGKKLTSSPWKWPESYYYYVSWFLHEGEKGYLSYKESACGTSELIHFEWPSGLSHVMDGEYFIRLRRYFYMNNTLYP